MSTAGSDAETDAIIAELERAGLVTIGHDAEVTIGHDAEGRETWTLTLAGAQVANQMAMSKEDDGLALLNAPLDART